MSIGKEIHRAPESLSVWESNMKEMSRTQPLLARTLLDYAERHGHGSEHCETRTPAGSWIERMPGEGDKKPFFQPEEKDKSGKNNWKFAWSRKTRKAPLFFLYGIGTPPYLFHAIRALPANALSLVVVEPSVALLAYTLHMTHVYQAMPEGARLVFLTRPDTTSGIGRMPDEERGLALSRLRRGVLDEALAVGVTAFGIFTATQAESSVHPGEEEAYREAFEEMSKEIREWTVLRLSALGNSAEDTMIGLRQMALMSPWIFYRPRVTSLREQFKGRPFVVVSAGPSLKKNFELLRGIRDKIVIIATDAVLKKMIKSGILPHIVCALERGAVTYETLFAESMDEYPEACSRILLVAQAVCSPKIFGRWPGPKAIVGKNEVPVDQWFITGILGGETIPSASSVAHMNYSLAANLGASSIALIGQDLALSDDGTTHAEGIFDEDSMANMKRAADAGPLYTVPGALGGEVRTTETWLAFLRQMESFIEVFHVPTWDCTEGGALIAGARVEPFADYIASHVAPLSPMERTPAEAFDVLPLACDRAARYAGCRARIDAEAKVLRDIGEMIGSLEKTMIRVAAPGLEPARRIGSAREAGALIDRINKASEMFAFITQSYVYLATMDLARTRSLETVEQIEAWTASHREIVDSHRAVLAFVRNWLAYASACLEHYIGNDLPLAPLEAGEAYEMFERFSEREQVSRFEIDALLARCDPPRLSWPGRALWAISNALMEEGRSQEAVSCMDAAAKEFDGQEMPVAEMAGFFKDYARALSTHDLCFAPPYHKAELMLSSAIEHSGGVDDESRAIMEGILEGQIATYTNMAGLAKGDFSGVAKWFTERAAGERALLSGDLPQALTLVWRAVSAHWRAVPDWAASHLDWLAKTIEKCDIAESPMLREATDRIKSEMAVSGELLGSIKVAFSMTFAETLIRHGLSPGIELVVRRDVQKPGDENVAEEADETGLESA